RGVALTRRPDGAPLCSVLEVVPEALALSLSVTVALTVKAASPGLLSRYWWLALNVSTPAARLNEVSAEPSPQWITTLCVSSVPGSLNDPDTVVLSFSLIVVGLALNETPDGVTLV